MELDYSQIIGMCAECLAVAMPIGFIFGITGKAYDLFMSMAFGKERVRL